MKGIVTALALTAALIVPSAPSALADGKTLVVGTNATFPPMQFVDKDKKITGYEMDLEMCIRDRGTALRGRHSVGLHTALARRDSGGQGQSQLHA